MIFDFTERLIDNAIDSIENAAVVVTDLACLEMPQRKRIVRLLADGVEIAAISAATGVAESVISEIASD